jgi:hypothetical protein
VDVDLYRVQRLEEHASALAAFTGVPRNRWFRSALERDETVPGGGSLRTRVSGGRCVFHNPKGRGCMIHAFSIERGIDYHELKPMTSCLFPVTYYDDVLCPSLDVEDGSLVCLDTGPSLYRGARGEIAYYFGEECVTELDSVEAEVLAALPHM